MARVAYVGPEQAAPEVREIYEQKLKGQPGNFQKALAHRPQLLAAFIPFYGSIGKAIGRRLYEMAYIRVALLNGCQYCLQHHLAASGKAGLSAEELQQLKDPDTAPFSPQEKAVLRYVDKLTRTPGNVAAEADALKQHFTDEQMVDLTATIALANFTNRISNGLAIELEIAAQAI